MGKLLFTVPEATKILEIGKNIMYDLKKERIEGVISCVQMFEWWMFFK